MVGVTLLLDWTGLDCPDCTVVGNMRSAIARVAAIVRDLVAMSSNRLDCAACTGLCTSRYTVPIHASAAVSAAVYQVLIWCAHTLRRRTPIQPYVASRPNQLRDLDFDSRASRFDIAARCRSIDDGAAGRRDAC